MASIVLFGPPGAGKGTQAAIIMAETGLPQVSTGDMLRAALSQGSSLGMEAKSFMEAGKLVPDSIIIGLIENRLKEKDASNGVLLDGFPRTIEVVLSIEVPDERIIKRICGRYSCPQCGAVYHDSFNPTTSEDICDNCSHHGMKRRADDNEETVSSRLKAYHSQTRPLADWYSQRGLFQAVDGDRDIELVGQSLLKVLSELRGE